MSDKKISQLNLATTANDSDLIPIVQSGETKKITKAILFSDLSSASSQTFHYQLSYLASESDIGKLMMQKWEGEGDLDRAAVYQEDPEIKGIFFLSFGNYGTAPLGAILTTSVYFPGTGWIAVQFTAVDTITDAATQFIPNVDMAIQYANIKATYMQNTFMTDNFIMSDQEGYSYALRFELKVGTSGEGYVTNNGSWYINQDWIQYPQNSGPFAKALGKLVSLEEEGWCTINPFNSLSFTAVGPIDKNAQIVGTNDGKVRARDMNNNDDRDCVLGLAKEAALDGEQVTLNYCPRTPQAWLDYSSDNRLPTTVQEAMDMLMWYYWD